MALGHVPDPMLAAPVLLALLLAAPAPSGAPSRHSAAGGSRTVSTAHARPGARPPARAASLEQAKAAMTALQRDPVKRRYRHNWERAVRNLERAARGPDAGPALLEAARARYALYRWSANEADRDEALRLAGRATAKGAKPAAALAAAIRAEAGDDRPEPRHPAPRPAAAPRQSPAAASARPIEPAVPVEPDAQDTAPEAPPDPALAAALADLSAGSAEPMRLGDSGGEGPARVSQVRSWSSGDYTRVAIYLSHWVGWQKLELPAAPGSPRRLALDFRPAELDRALARPVDGKQVDRVRAAQNDAETVRVVLDLPGADRVRLFGLDDPPRLIVDVGSAEPARKAPAVAAVPPAHAADSLPPPPPPPSPERSGTGSIRRIVVDAGHGGQDPGAIGAGRVREKDVTLAIATRLARQLREDGFEVVLTRDRDRTLALEERTALANTAGADLFVSVHANAHPRRNRVGIETYFLNVADDRYAARLAARENGVDLGSADEQANRILTDLDAKTSASSSHRLASLVQREVTGGVRARVGDVRDLGVKSALFYVLLGARMPAVLVETGFISNREEERRLASPRYQDEVAAGISRAVSAYARSEARVAAR